MSKASKHDEREERKDAAKISITLNSKIKRIQVERCDPLELNHFH